jgi:hypothetical protein
MLHVALWNMGEKLTGMGFLAFFAKQHRSERDTVTTVCMTIYTTVSQYKYAKWTTVRTMCGGAEQYILLVW